MSKNAFIIYNPRSGKKRERSDIVNYFRSLLSARGVDSEAKPTERPNHASELAREALDRGFDLVVANGGDGTMNEVLQTMVGASVPLAVWPAGTANVLALDLNLPRTPETIANMIAADRRKRINVGRAGNRYFFFAAGVGLDAGVINAVNAQLKKHIGKGAFWIAGFSHLVKWHPVPIILNIDGKRHECTFAVIGKSYGYGGSLSITPYARLDEDMLDVCCFSGSSKIQYVNYLVACLNNNHLNMEGVSYIKTKRIDAAAPMPVPVQVDGEIIGGLPMTFEAVPDAITLIVP